MNLFDLCHSSVTCNLTKESQVTAQGADPGLYVNGHKVQDVVLKHGDKVGEMFLDVWDKTCP